MSGRVVVTGMNMITALGLDRESNWAGLRAGCSGVRPITLFTPEPGQTAVAAELPAGFSAHVSTRCSRRVRRQLSRGALLGYTCATGAIATDHIVLDGYAPERCGVIFGLADTGHAAADNDEFWILKTMPHAVPALLATDLGLHGPSFVVSAACASSAYAIALASDLIRTGVMDAVIAGGCSAIVNREHVRGFDELGALARNVEDPERASCPFSAGRRGFVIGEGAGVLVLEAEDAARRRGARIHAEVAGHAITNEAHNLMSPRSDGAGMAATMRAALEAADVKPEDVDCVNAHGTSTLLNDLYETRAIEAVFGCHARSIPVSAPKSMIGHTAGACGAVEAVITILSMMHGVVTPTINYVPDPDLGLDYVPEGARIRPIQTAISNSFGFGGCNATLVFRRAPPFEPHKTC